MQVYRCDTFSRETDLIACYLGYGGRMLDEGCSVAALMVLQRFFRYVICRFYELFSSFVISWEKFVYTLHILLISNNLQS